MRIIAIVGSSGAGKDMVAQLLSVATCSNVIVSYTTRPMREGETDGKEHHFVKECNVPEDQRLAYTVFGGYEYWTTREQIQGTSIYIIDEEGLRFLRERFPDIDIASIYVSASKRVRRSRGVSEERIKRDDLREQFPLEYYDYVIYNNRSLGHLMARVTEIADQLKEKGYYGTYIQENDCGG